MASRNVRGTRCLERSRCCQESYQMIKWIGQHIWDFVSRFRNDVYLENIADGTVANDKFLGLDSNNKIVKEAIIEHSKTDLVISIPGYVAGITSNSNYYHRQSTSFLNWSGVDADPTSAFPAADLVTCWFIAPHACTIDRIRVQGVSNTTDPFKFHVFKTAASSDGASENLTLVFSTQAITPDTADESYEYNRTDGGALAAGDRVYVFYKKDSGSGSVNNYWNISLQITYTS